MAVVEFESGHYFKDSLQLHRKEKNV